MMIAYLIVSVLAKKARGLRTLSELRVSLGMTFDAATFATSLLILWGIADPVILRAIGDTYPFLAISGLLGLVYSLHSLARTD